MSFQILTSLSGLSDGSLTIFLLVRLDPGSTFGGLKARFLKHVCTSLAVGSQPFPSASIAIELFGFTIGSKAAFFALWWYALGRQKSVTSDQVASEVGHKQVTQSLLMPVSFPDSNTESSGVSLSFVVGFPHLDGRDQISPLVKKLATGKSAQTLTFVLGPNHKYIAGIVITRRWRRLFRWVFGKKKPIGGFYLHNLKPNQNPI